MNSIRVSSILVGLAALALAATAQAAGQSAPSPERHVKQAAYRAEGVPAAPDDAAWEQAPAFELALQPQVIQPPVGGGSVQSLSVQALHDGEWLALRLSWADPVADREVGVDAFRDAVAVGFPTTEGERLPSPFMGDEQETVDIWQWNADLAADRKGEDEFAERYPHTEGVWHFPQDESVSKQVKTWRGTSPAVELTAAGFGTLERKGSQDVEAQSLREGDRWQVVLRRKLESDAGDTVFRPGEITHLIAAVWNGAEDEVNGRKSVTLAWTDVVLEPVETAESAAAAESRKTARLEPEASQ